jgi:hypothetical protein
MANDQPGAKRPTKSIQTSLSAIDALNATRDKTDKIYEAVVAQTTDIEKKMSPGGSQIQTYMNDLQVVVGGSWVGADVAAPVSVIENYMVPDRIVVGKDRTDIRQKSSPHVQSVTHSIPWGSYGVVASNKYNVVAGAGGIMMHTDGCLDVTSAGRASITSLHELNISSSNGNMNIVCGHHINMQGDTVSIRSNSGQVIVNSDLGVARNATIHGSMYVDGELYVQHITGPAVARETSQGVGDAVFPPGTKIGYAIVPEHGRCPVYADTASGFLLPHTHTYYTIASDLASSNASVRTAAASDVDGRSAGVAKNVEHGGSGLM